MTTNPTGVDEGTTVITSENTTAIIVENGNAYLYDSLQEAVDAVANGRGSDGETPATITLLKDTTGDVTLKTDTKFNISKADDITNGATYKTEDGYEVKTDPETGSVSVAPIEVTSVTLSPATLKLTVGGEAGNLTATVEPSTASQNVTWSSSDESVAKVDANGVVTAVAEGTATITATSAVDSNKIATCTVTVKPAAIPVTKIALSKTSLSLREGKTETLTATVEPENATDKTITWSSSDESIAKVDANGVVTAVSAGTATITATAGGYSATCTVTVTSPYIPVPPTPVTPGKPVEPDEPDEPDNAQAWTNPYTDVSVNDWFYASVAYVSGEGIMSGVSAAAFAPNDAMTRAMVWTVLARLSGRNVDGGSPWYAPAQSWAMVNGVSDGTEPSGSITREQLVTMLYRYAGSPSVGVSELAKLSQFTDGETVSAWAQEAMAWAVSAGVINGTDGALAPQGSATRAQVAAILMRYLENVQK